MLTIGELARYAGVTTRTVRHYHALGLLPEPPRDELGYRSYNADHLLTLQRISVLAAAGVPLKRIPAVLDASPIERASHLDEIDADLQRQQEALAATRERLEGLRTDPDGLPPNAHQLLARLVEIGVNQRQVDVEREAWRLTWLLYPELTLRWLTQQIALFDDDEYAELYRQVSELADADPDDPRIEELAARNVAWTMAHRADYEAWAAELSSDPLASEVMQAHTVRVYGTPANRRLMELVTRGMREAMAQDGRDWSPR